VDRGKCEQQKIFARQSLTACLKLLAAFFRFAAPLADRHYVMEHGKIVAAVEKHELSEKADMLHEFLGL
jgi:ABC-type branched-subunit amino acid transport system ATPase component